MVRPGRIQVTPAFRALAGEAFAYQARGRIDMKGLGIVETAFLTGNRPARLIGSARVGDESQLPGRDGDVIRDKRPRSQYNRCRRRRRAYLRRR